MSESYDYFITMYERLLNECANKSNPEVCRKLQIIKFLKGQYGNAFGEFEQNFNSFINQTVNQEDLSSWENQYNEFYKKMLSEKDRLEKETKDLNDLIKFQSSNTDQYDNIINQRNKEIENNIENIDSKTEDLATLNQDLEINDEKKDIIYLLGWIPLNPYPMKTRDVMRFYQIVNIVLLLFLIFFLKAIKDKMKNNNS